MLLASLALAYLLGIVVLNMFQTGQAKKNNHEEAYPDEYKLSEELLNLEER